MYPRTWSGSAVAWSLVGVMMRSNDKIYYDYYAMAFIDILGQKDQFNALDERVLEHDSRSLIEVHKNTVMYVDRLRIMFEDFFKAIQAPIPPSTIHANNQQIYAEMMSADLIIQRYSDFIQAAVSLHTENYHSRAVKGVFGLFMGCGSMLLLALSTKKAFRAGIDVGLGTLLDNGELYGPVAYRAYELESKIAKYPRIVVGSKLIEYLSGLLAETRQFEGQTERDIKFCAMAASTCLNVISKDSDGTLIVDYLGPGFLDCLYKDMNDTDKAQYKANYRSAFKFVSEERDRWTGLNNAKLSGSYSRLLEYFERSKPAW